jgi:shikimate 5-dehydrogenase
MITSSGEAEVRPAVTVLGLGEMGATVAGAFLAGGHPTTVWNRTPTRAAALVTQGARRATTVCEAVAASPLVVVSVTGNDVAREVLEPAATLLAGRAVVNLTDGTSASATAVARWVTARGAQYLHGQVMTIAPAVADAEAVVAEEIDSGEHATPYGALRQHLPLVRDMLEESRARRIDEELPGYTYALTSKAVDNGQGDDSYSRLVEHFRATGWH